MTKIDFFRGHFREQFGRGDYKGAIETGKRLLMEQAYINMAGTENYARDMYNLALAFEESGDTLSALETYRNTAWHSSNLDENGMLFAKSLSGMAAIVGEMGQAEPSYFMHAKVCEIYSANMGDDAPEFADSLYNLASAASEMGLGKDALKYHKKALEIREKAGGSEDILDSLRSIAAACEAAEAYDEACDYAKRAAELSRDESDAGTHANCCAYLGGLHAKRGDIEEALEMYTSAARALRGSLGKKHSAYMNMAFARANILTKAGKLFDAAAAYGEIIEALEERPGSRSLFYAGCLRNLAVVYETAGDWMAARATLMKSMNAKRSLKSDLMLDAVFLMRLNFKLGLDREAFGALVYALMCLQFSPWGYDDARALIVSVLMSEAGDDCGLDFFADEIDGLPDSGEMDEHIDQWIDWELDA